MNGEGRHRICEFVLNNPHLFPDFTKEEIEKHRDSGLSVNRLETYIENMSHDLLGYSEMV